MLWHNEYLNLHAFILYKVYDRTVRLNGTHCICAYIRNTLLADMLIHCGLVTPYGDTIGSGSGLLPTGTKPLPGPILTYHQWGPVIITWGQFHKIYPQPLITEISLTVTYVKLKSNRPEANGLRIHGPGKIDIITYPLHNILLVQESNFTKHSSVAIKSYASDITQTNYCTRCDIRFC